MKIKVYNSIFYKLNLLISTDKLLKIIVLALIFTITTLPSYSQSFCSTNDISFKEINKIVSSRNNSGPLYVKIYIHVIRRSNGTGGHTPTTVDQVFSLLENDFSPHNIFFVWDCVIDYIDNTSFYNMQGTGSIFSVNDHSDGVDIYLFPDKPGVAGGNAMAQNIPSSAFYVSGNYFNSPFQSLTTSSVTSHEMGHCLGLSHTHASFCFEPELVDGSNCATCGDRFCDTPADPNMSFEVDEFTCQWQGSGNDPNGDPYNPDENLIMSYTHPTCMTTFTNEQGQWMRDVLLSVNQNVLTSPIEIPSINGPNTVFCGAYFHITPVSGIPSYNWTWQGGCGSVYGTGTVAYLYGNCGFATGGLLCVTADFSCPSVPSVQRCRTLSLLPCGYLKEEHKDDDIELRSISIRARVYPNPAIDKVTIEVKGIVQKEIELVDIKGTVISTLSTTDDKTNLDISNLDSGIYFVRIFLESGEILTKKFLVGI